MQLVCGHHRRVVAGIRVLIISGVITSQHCLTCGTEQDTDA